MKKLALVLAASLICLAGHARAADIYDCYNGSSEQGGNRTTTNGIQSLQYVQQSFPGAQVDVYIHNTTTHPPAIWQDGAGTIPLANPFSASNHGVAFVCAPDGRYDFKYSLGGITTPFTVSDIKYCFACAGGGGGSITPGTPFQVTRYDSTGNNIQNSTGSDNPIFGPTQWSQGLSVTSNGLAKFGVNSPAGTTVNLLVCADSSVTSMTQVTTCATSTNKTFGVADNGAGTTGNVEIYDHGYHACMFDNQTIVNDYVGPSSSIAGDCDDVGPTKPSNSIVIGRVTTVNTGAATLATVDLQPWDTVSGPGGSGTVNNCGTAGSNAFYLLAGTAINCDPLVQDDNAGDVTMESLGLINTNFAGFYYQKQGPLPPSTPVHAVAEYPPTSVTAYAEQRPGAVGSVGQTRIIQSLGTDGSGNPIAVETWGSTGSSGNTTAANPSAPTVTPKGSTGATSYSYGVVGCQDVGCTSHSAISPTGSTSTGNATLTSSNFNQLTAYADTLYGYRGILFCRLTGGATQGVITGSHASPQFSGKIFNDTGLTGDGTNCATAYATNTTTLSPVCLGAAVPGIPSTPGFPCGVDGPPLAPNALDDEMMANFGAPADVNNAFYTKVNFGSATAAWTGGAISLTLDAGGGSDAIRGLVESTVAPSTPFTFIVYVDAMATQSKTQCGIIFRESSSTKSVTFGLQQRQTVGSATAGSGFTLDVTNWTNDTTAAGNPGSPTGLLANMPIGGIYLKLQDDGTNIKASWSNDGIAYSPFTSFTVASVYTTGPNQVGVYGDPFTATAGDICVYDYIRRTQ